jgi:F0F1-type ATP synthase delta subunit
MLENATLARPYAKAIFAIAGDDQSGYSEQINLLAAIVADPQLTALIGHPRIPMPLSETQQAALQKNLAQRFGSAIELGARVDESLLAGVIVRAGDQVIDASARGRLQRLGQAMQHG